MMQTDFDVAHGNRLTRFVSQMLLRAGLDLSQLVP